MIRSQPPTTFGSVFLTCWRKPKIVFNSFIHCRVIWDPWGFNVNFPFLLESYNLFGSLFWKESTKWTSAHLLFGACIYTTCICCSHADNCTMQIVLFNPFHTRFPMLAGMIFPIAMKNPPTTVICFHLIPLGLLSQFKCSKVGSNLTSPNSKLGEFGEILVDWIFIHTIHQIGCNFWWEKLNFHTISLTLGSMVYPCLPPPKKQTKQCQPMQEWKVPQSRCVWQQDPDFEEHTHWTFLSCKSQK